MIFKKTDLEGAFIIEVEKIEDERGFFARTWDLNKFNEMGCNGKFVQCSISFNKKKATLRGMHYQTPPYQEAKLVRCTKGKIFDVIIDLRANSNTFKKWISFELSEDNHTMLYVPEGFAHGFLTLSENSEVFYQISEFYHPEYAQGIRWNDPTFSISWPLKPEVISLRDNNYGVFEKL